MHSMWKVDTYDSNNKCTTTIEKLKDFEILFMQSKDGVWAMGLQKQES